jgi:hypothetical protein
MSALLSPLTFAPLSSANRRAMRAMQCEPYRDLRGRRALQHHLTAQLSSQSRLARESLGTKRTAMKNRCTDMQLCAVQWGCFSSVPARPRSVQPSLRGLCMLMAFSPGLESLRENRKGNRRSLHYATPDFLSSLVALANFLRLSLRKAAYVTSCGTAM